MLKAISFVNDVFRNEVKHSNQNVSFDVFKICLIHNTKVEFRQKHDSTCLTTSELFNDHKVFQKLVINKDFNRNVDNFKFRASMLQTFDND